ncbi:hypothetical protein [Agrobacterium tumefaciens]|uniref:hypothetical protein n=1 Tax=Agrobacterium tumefaciens TaxID=358 RepID=UPI001AED5A77|nr:hypothetical protein [Agrobacterium tumefaciens]
MSSYIVFPDRDSRHASLILNAKPWMNGRILTIKCQTTVGLRELGGLTAFTALQNAAKMDGEANDMEGILFTLATLAEWSDRFGFENEFASVFASGTSP